MMPRLIGYRETPATPRLIGHPMTDTQIYVRTFPERTSISWQPDLLTAIRVFGGEEALVMWDRDVCNAVEGRTFLSFDEAFGNNVRGDWDCFKDTIRIYFSGVSAAWVPKLRRWCVVVSMNGPYGRVAAEHLREAIIAAEDEVELEELKQEGLV